MKKLIPILVLIAGAGLSAKDKKENIADLKSADDTVAIKAAQELGADGAKDAIEPLGELLKSNRSTAVRISAASALGRIGEKGRSTTLLKESIEVDQDNHVIYTELLALLNLADIENPDLTKAVEYCETNKKSDIYIADLLTRIRKKFPKKEEKAAAPADAKPADAAK